MSRFIFVGRRMRPMPLHSVWPPRARRPMRATMIRQAKLVLVEQKDRQTAWYRTADGQYDVLGHDLATSRAAGAGAVWSYRPAKPTADWTDDMVHFASLPACLEALKAVQTATPTAHD